MTMSFISVPELNSDVSKTMHALTFLELKKLNLIASATLIQTIEEIPLLSETQAGVYDFYFKANGKTIGMEVLARPSKGKLKQKLFYANYVDEFIFVLPVESFNFYKIQKLAFLSKVRPSYFSKEFNSEKLFVWLLDLEKKEFIAKNRFNKVFRVDP
ncbi:MAG: hypothetical protein Q7S92_05990 [Candidatus Diapherotrites archaeon]|nr:hypothetical protein [Candidatus Diapherotrites archaeon]